MDDRKERSGRPDEDTDPADTNLGKRGFSQTGDDAGQTEHSDDNGQIASQLDLKGGESQEHQN